MRNPRPTPRRGEAGARLTLERIIPHLQGVRREGREYKALCPCHDDHDPSLSLTETADGTLLVHCLAGCPQDRVWAELLRLAGRSRPSRGRSERPASREQRPATSRESESQDLEPAGLKLAEYARAKHLNPALLQQWELHDSEWQGKPCVAIPYLNERGETVATRFRIALHGDRFRWRQGDRPILYGLWRVHEWDDELCYLVEGESDTHTLWSANLPALGVPGAATWRAEWWFPLMRFQRVVVAADSDEAGQSLVARLAETCPEAMLNSVEVAQLPCKDVSELWVRCNADASRFREAIQSLPKRPLAEFGAREEQEPAEPLLAPLGELLQRESPELEYIPLLGIPDLLARGTATLLSAYPKCGKSTMLAHASREWIRAGLRTVFLSEECLLAWKIRSEKMPELQQLIISRPAWASPERWVAELERIEPDVCIIDTIRAFGNIESEGDPAAVARAVGVFVELTRRNPRTAVVLCHHTRKTSEREPTLQDVAGAHAFAGSADGILLLSESDTHPRRRILHPIAGRLWHNREPLVLELSEDGQEYRCVGIESEVEPQSRVAQWREQVVQAIAAIGRASAEQVHKFLKEAGSPHSLRWVRTTLAALCGEGILQREGKGRRGDSFVYYLPEQIEEPDCGTGEQSINNAIPQFLNREQVCGSGLGNTSSIALPQFLNREEPQELRNCGTALIIGTSSVPQTATPPRATAEPPSANGTEPRVASGDAESEDSESVLTGEALVEAILQEFQGSRILSEREALLARLRQRQRDPVAPLSDAEVAQALELWTLAESKRFPRLVIPDYAVVERGALVWRVFIERAAGSGAIALALELLQQRPKPNGQPSLFADLDTSSSTTRASDETLHNAPTIPS